MNQADKLRTLIDPSYAHTLATRDMLAGIPAIKGEPGYTPVKGVDYFTAEEVQAVIAHVINQVQAGVENGTTPVRGVDYFDGSTPTTDELLALIKPLIPKVKNGADGHAPTSGELKALIAPLIPKPKDAKMHKIEDIVAAAIPAIKEELSYRHIKDAPPIDDLNVLIAFLRRGGFRGGGSSATTAAGTTKYADLSLLTDGVTKIFAIPTFTSVIGLQGSDAPFVYRPTVDFVAAGLTLTLATAVPAPSAGATLIFTYS